VTLARVVDLACRYGKETLARVVDLVGKKKAHLGKGCGPCRQMWKKAHLVDLANVEESRCGDKQMWG